MGRESEFVRTPKHGVVAKNQNWAKKKYRAGKEIFSFMELALGLYFTPQVVREGSILLMDGGCKVEGYSSDISRTFVLGKPTQRMKDVCEIEHKAQTTAVKTARPGLPCEAVDAAARKVIVDAGFVTASDAAIAMDPTNADLKAQLEGARFVWNEYRAAMKVLAEIKGDAVITRLKRAGAPNAIKWDAPKDSKGNLALTILSDRD